MTAQMPFSTPFAVPTSIPFAPVRFGDVLTARHHAECARHHHPSLVQAQDTFWSLLPWSQDAVLHTVACVKAACHLRTEHGTGLTALLWLIPVWTDDELSAVVHHPDVRAEPQVASALRVALDQRCETSSELSLLGPARHTTYEVIDRANRALQRVELVHPRGVTLTEHLAQVFLDHEEQHMGPFETLVQVLGDSGAHPLIERLIDHATNERLRQACHRALAPVSLGRSCSS